MKPLLILTLACVFLLFSREFSYADRPQLLIVIENNPTLKLFNISSWIVWNQDNLNDAKVAHFEKEGIFYGKTTGNVVERQYQFLGNRLRVVMKFPKKESGRRLNESTRVELSLYQNETHVFSSKYFGQHSEEFTDIPASGLKFRPQNLRLYEVAKGKLYIDLCGEYGKSTYIPYGTQGSIGVSPASCLTRRLTEMLMDDSSIEKAVKKTLQPIDSQ